MTRPLYGLISGARPICLLVMLALLFGGAPGARAGEGMWLPLWLARLNEADMQRQGMRLTARDIYAVNNSSLKDAVVHFGGFCTGEIIGRRGLVLTNHHCGMGAIQSHSRVGRNLVDEGFWARGASEELPNPGLYVAILDRMEDVTPRIREALARGYSSEAERERLVQARIKEITDEAGRGGLRATVTPMFYGSEYYLFVNRVYEDVRLVGAPPYGIGSYGGDTDNWMWPRHTGDFSLFRIYAGPDNRPAPYGPGNVPYQPNRHLTINLSGLAPGDFTMVMGYPGRTQQYLPSWGITAIEQHTNPYKVALRTRRLDIIRQTMASSAQGRIAYAAKYAQIANAWKKWQGETRGLRRLSVAERKRTEEAALARWIAADTGRVRRFGAALPALEVTYRQQNQIILAVEYFREALQAGEIMALAASQRRLLTIEGGALTEAGQARVRDLAGQLRGSAPGYFRNYDRPTDERLLTAGLEAWQQDLAAAYHPPSLAGLLSGRPAGAAGAVPPGITRLYEQSALADSVRLRALHDRIIADPVAGLAAMAADPAIKLYEEFAALYGCSLLPVYQSTQATIDEHLRTLTEARRQMAAASPGGGRAFYPDANSTLRVAYGQIAGYDPMDGATYHPFTFMEGLLDKRDTTVSEFNAPRRLVELARRRDFGPYADASGQLPIAFIASNHTTGGNSGSPVLNARGELIGTNYDRVWEGTMSDLAYDVSLCRNIALDVRYMLWVVDKLYGAGYLLEEMTLSREPVGPRPASGARPAGRPAVQPGNRPAPARPGNRPAPAIPARSPRP